jgi:hypothetical protein
MTKEFKQERVFMERIQRWLYNLRTNLFDRGDIYTLLIAIVLLLMPVLSLRAAQWPLEMRTIVPVTIVGVLFGYAVSRSRFNELFALMTCLIYGVVVVIFIAGVNEPTNNPISGVYMVMQRVVEWVYDAFTGGINQDDTVFTLLVGLLFWYVGYNASWHIFRIDRVWRVILPPAIILFGNMALYSGRNDLTPYLLIFVMMSFLLLIRSSIENREIHWFYSGIRMPHSLRPQFLTVGVVIALICLGFAWFLPQQDIEDRLTNFQEFMRSDVMQNIGEQFNRLFAPIESEGPATTDYYANESLSLTGSIRLGDQPILFVQAPNDGRRYYWRSRVFERYENGQWSPSSTWRITDGNAPINLNLAPEFIGTQRQPVSHTFTVATIASRLLYSTGQPQTFDTTGRVDLLRLDENLGENSPMNVSVVRPLRALEPGMSFTSVGLVSTATADQLRSAGTNYPQWVTNPNTFSGTISPRVIEFGRVIVANAGATNPYDQAKAIETWLRQNITYNETIPTPPQNVDTLEWFLFELREGYCTYSATAMAAMLRGLGIPARLAAGFSEGEYDAANGRYVVRERDAHTWVEVFFPGYGWVEFEPTSSDESIVRPGDATPTPNPMTDSANVASATPIPSPTSLPSPTPTPTNTPQATPERQEQDQPSTPTPTPSPTPTVTPVVVPTVQPPVAPPPPPNNNFVEFLLRAVGTAFVIVLVVLVFIMIAVLLWWWWEWRGMGGLSPVARAYKRLERYIGLIGVKYGEEKTPEEKRKDIINKLPQAEKPVTYITRTYIRERYSAPNSTIPETTQDTPASDKAWYEARGSILRRWLRRFIPFLRNR